MRYSALCVLLLAISEPLFIHAKMILVVPRQVRRTPSWKPSSPYYKKNYGSNEFHRPTYYSPAQRYYSKKPFRPLPYGGDDFDQGHETVNHVHVPYGKDVSHGISFGKGYIPYDNIKSSSLPFVPERYAGAYTRQPAAPDYPPTGFTSVGQEYSASATANSYESPQHDSFFSDMEGAARGDSLKENANKYYASRSIEKDLTLKNQQALSSAIERDKDSKGIEGQHKIAPTVYGHIATDTQGAVILPAGIPAATIAGNKDGIVLRDTVSMDEYHRKLQELTKTWPNVLATGASTAYGGVIPASHQQLHAGFAVTGLPGSGFAGPTGGGWIANFAQSKQGYAVREDHGDPAAYDFRTMPIHAASYQHLPLGVPTDVAAIASHHHG
ncbi:uncharacterized protein [Linepithema humile]|uniref:uncharacterized protein isoform X2 n=1 Tax=Linepithema humile TaxID=83485 RepID=UPI000623A9C2|nr:PREDICTED: uncharacterized protein LOC105676376 isoform X2 [Linepithema humile]